MLDDAKRSRANKQTGLEHTAIWSNPETAEADFQEQASLIVIAGWEIGRELRLRKQSTTFGRSSQADHLINAPSVSRLHARIDRSEVDGVARFILSDLGSSNGVFVNNRPCTQTVLYPGNKVRMGDVLFKFMMLDEIDARFHQEVQRLIYYDRLTGLMTMEAFRPQLELAIRKAKKKESIFCLVMADLDGLKRVNDTYGHLAGRMVVREMGVLIRNNLRPQDLGALYGGDETIMLYPETPLDAAAQYADALREAIANRSFTHNENDVRVSISQGVAEWPRHASGPEALIAAADKALYKAKALGRNRVCTVDEV